ncbi:MAG: alpha-glucan family phosphorylase [Myxococcota bacterium]
MRCSGGVNGVSQLHAAVSRSMWQCLWPGADAGEVPIVGVTNGIHTPTWVGEEMRELLDRYLGERWRDEPSAPTAYAGVDRIPDAELWRTHERARERLVSFVRDRAVRTAERLRLPPQDIAALGEVLDPRALTIGFARRFATYKRATLLLKHPERLRKLLLDEARPVQLIFAGKAHPQDVPAKELIQELVHFARDPAIRRRIVFVEEYDMGVARKLVQGVDVWLNNPRRPKEASGTSGMKVVANGGLNLSVLDGWWAEAYDGDNGWAIGHGESYEDTDKGDEIEARELLEVLEYQVVPEFYARGPDHLPHRWCSRMKRSIATLSGFFSTDRMVREYAERLYLPGSAEGAEMARLDYEPARALARQVGRLERGWHGVKLGEAKIDAPYDLVLGQAIGIEVEVQLGSVEPDDVVVEAVGGLVDGSRRVVDAEVTPFERVGQGASGWYRYRGTWTPKMAGHNGCLLRLRPAFARGAPARELAIRFWE